MKEVAVYEAKTRLSELLAEVAQGEQFTITRRGVAVARLVAAAPGAAPMAGVSRQRLRVEAAIEALRVLGQGVTLDLPLADAIAGDRD
jgi:prevent-host-death family protein